MKYIIETERTHLFDVNIIITMNVKLENELPFELLKTAYEKACALHEVLLSKVIIESSGEAFYVDNTAPQNSFCKTDLSLAELISENQKRRFRIEDGEFMRVFYSPDGLVFMMHHLGGDGKSLLYFIETFMKCLAGKETAFVPFKNLTLENLPAETRVSGLYKMLLKSWNKSWNKNGNRQKKIFTFEDLEKAYSDFWGEHKTKLEIKKYEANELSDLLAAARSAGVSLTAYLITQLAKESSVKTDIGLAVDGRLDKNRAMGNQATGISIQYKYDDKKSFEENVRVVHSLMKQKLSDENNRYFFLKFMGMMDSTLKDSLNLEHTGYYHSKTSAKVAQMLGYGNYFYSADYFKRKTRYRNCDCWQCYDCGSSGLRKIKSKAP